MKENSLVGSFVTVALDDDVLADAVDAQKKRSKKNSKLNEEYFWFLSWFNPSDESGKV